MLKFKILFIKIISFYYVYYFFSKYFFKIKEDSNGNITLEKQGYHRFLPVLPKYIKNNLEIRKNYKSLIGCPIEVGGSFDCSDNYLTNLDGIPKLVGSSINCSKNFLTSLKGVQEIVYGNFDCKYNQLTSLKYCPTIVNVNFDCRYNKITNLEHSPQIVNGDFDCSHNKITTLYNSPKEIGGSFFCSYTHIFSLENCPKLIKKYLDCRGNQYLKNVKEQIKKYNIEAEYYFTDEGDFTYEDIFGIKNEIENKTSKNLKKEENKTKENKIKNIDFGIGI